MGFTEMFKVAGAVVLLEFTISQLLPELGWAVNATCAPLEVRNKIWLGGVAVPTW